MVEKSEAARIAKASLDAHQKLRGAMSLCSWQVGWRSLLLRGYNEPTEAEEFVIAPTPDHLLVLVTEGSCRAEGRFSGRWQNAHYLRGDIGMGAPNEEIHIRWREGRDFQTLQLHIPATTLADVVSLDPGSPCDLRLPSQLAGPDATIENVVLSLGRAASANASELYADSAVHFLASHLLQFHSGVSCVAEIGSEPRRMTLADALLRESLGSDLSLDQLASATGMSKFHLLRVFKDTFGETPFRRLTRYRMEAARKLLKGKEAAISSVAYACGYENPTHFAIAFRRFYGVSPSAYRASVKG